MLAVRASHVAGCPRKETIDRINGRQPEEELQVLLLCIYYCTNKGDQEQSNVSTREIFQFLEGVNCAMKDCHRDEGGCA